MIPFFALPTALRVPSPKIVSAEEDFTLIAAPSKSEFVASVAASSLSVSVVVPTSFKSTELEPFTTSGAVVDDESVRLSRISVTSETPFATTMLPSVELPLMR